MRSKALVPIHTYIHIKVHVKFIAFDLFLTNGAVVDGKSPGEEYINTIMCDVNCAMKKRRDVK